MKSGIVRALRAALVVLALGLPSVMMAPVPAHAVIGRPLTPLSYAGVARRTTRRTVAASSAAYATAAAATPHVAALPPGCTMAGGVYHCGAVGYQPVYDGPNVVYVPVG
jgi:hypothetical protein